MPQPFDDAAFAPPTAPALESTQTGAETGAAAPVVFGALTMVYAALVASFWSFTLAVSWMFAGLGDEAGYASLELLFLVTRTVVVFGGVPVGLWVMYRPREGMWVLALFALAHLGPTAASDGVTEEAPPPKTPEIP